MDQLIQTLRNFGVVRLAIFAAVILGVGSGLHYLTGRAGNPELALLYSNLDLADAGKIVSKIEAMGVDAEILGGGTEVYVPTGKVARLRMEMAEIGLPRGGSLGYEIFDRDEALGTSSFVQDINRLRALEGEIARSISSLAQVQSARVHLVLPRRELFSRDRQEPSASIVLSLNGPGRLNNNRVQAVQHMVAAAVPGLVPEKVSIVDDRGNLLARGDNSSDILSAGNLEEMRLAYENRLSHIVEGLVEKHVGPGKVRAEISASMNFDRITENSEEYDPDGQVIRSTQTISEDESSSDTSKGNTAQEGELPKGQEGAAAGSTSALKRTEETVNYEITKKVKSHTREIGAIQKLSIAVMVDGSYKKAAEEGAEETYQPRTPEEMEKIKTLVKNAIGFNEDRGDTVEVINMKFAQPSPVGTLGDTPSAFSLTQPDVVRLVEAFIIGLMGLLMLLMVVKPVIIRLLEGAPQAAPPVEEEPVEDPSNSNAANQAPAPTPIPLPQKKPLPPLPPPNNDEMERMISLQQIEGDIRESSVKQISTVIQENPGDAVSVVREWIHEK